MQNNTTTTVNEELDKDVLQPVSVSSETITDESAGACAWRLVYSKVLELEKQYAKDNNTEHINMCIRLENLMNYFKDEICK